MSSAPRLLPSSLNWTPATAASSAAFAVTVVEATTVEPPAGAVIETVGGVVSGGRVVKLHVWAPASAIPLAARTVDSSRTV